jgi:hypothetical protein
MNCPDEIADIVLELIQTSLLRIRAQGWAGNSARCAVEAAHVHNLPDLLRDFSSERLHFYWEVERWALLQEMGDEARPYQEL